MTEQERPPVDLEQIRQGFAWVDGYWAVVKWEEVNPNPIWITGPYLAAEDAQRDITFFTVNAGLMYPNIVESAVVGKGYDAGMEGTF